MTVSEVGGRKQRDVGDLENWELLAGKEKIKTGGRLLRFGTSICRRSPSG